MHHIVVKQSKGIGHSVTTMHQRLQTPEHMSAVKFLNTNSICAEYLVEVFKYPGTRNRIPSDSTDGYRMTQMIGLYSLVELYSITRITTTQSGVIGKDEKKKSTSKCYCTMCDYVVQNHLSINNHV